MRARLVVIAALAACSPPRHSPLEHAGTAPATQGSDPWSELHAAAGSSKPDDSGLAGLQGILAKLKEAIATPGPYEAPEHSPGFDARKPHWAVMKLSGTVVEREAYSLGGGHSVELRTLTDRLRALAKDEHLVGLVLRVGGLGISLPDAVELRLAMHDFRAAGKGLRCYAEDMSNTTYLVVAACDSIGIAPLGVVAITGPAAMPIHVKPLLDKLGIQADFLHVGAYKGAAEPLTRDAPSKEMEETLGAILDQRYATMVDVIASERKLDPAQAKALIDTGLFTSDQAKAAHLIDEVAPFEAFRDESKAPWTRVRVVPGDADQAQLAAWMKIARFLGIVPPERPSGPHVAVVYALGNIVDGDGDGVLGARQEIAAHTLVAALRAIAADDEVKAVVLRVDSGGGSAQASELIWHAVNELRANKPVVVSMSDVAASGGYYISSDATKIFALDDTLTGSIGVVGGKLAPAGALAKLGINTFPIGRGKHATMMASLGPWTADEQAIIQGTMQSVYDQFVARVAEGRHKKPADILPIAQGRVWTGARAKELGLVDEIGGLDAALAAAQDLGKVPATTELEIYPPAPTLRDLLVGFGQVQAPLGLRSSLDQLRALDPAIASAAEQLVAIALSFRDAQIQTVAVLPPLY
ncbi:MAG TPA: signal peptide peptidase SppA [Kofleriaceae bacterium]|nr:signal peptide peptidase SppA [Kofleriaceae bacterium]